MSEQKEERINVKKKRKKENKTKKNPKLISVINLRSPKKEEERKPTMEAYKYPLISQPNSVHYATCLGLVFCKYEYLFTREKKSEQFNFVSFSYICH